MTIITKPSYILLVSSLAIIIGTCSASCGIEKLSIVTSWTGDCLVGKQIMHSFASSCEVGKEVILVEVTNNCECALNDVVLRCVGFDTVLPVNPNVIRQVGDECLLLQGHPIPVRSPIVFKCAFDSPSQSFVPLKALRC